MSRFKIGDRVRREASPEGGYIRVGSITEVRSDSHGLELFTEYEVDFGADGVLVAYESQLEPDR